MHRGKVLHQFPDESTTFPPNGRLTMNPNIPALLQPGNQALQTLARQLFTQGRGFRVCAREVGV